MNASETNEMVKTTETSLRIIEVLMELDETRVEVIADRLDVAPSTVHRHLKTLKNHGYVLNEGGLYRLGLQFLTVGGYIRDRQPEYNLAKNTCQDLAEQTEERIQFEVEEQGQRIFVHTAIGEHAVKANGMIGRRGPLHCSAAGKAILASFTDHKIEQIIEERGLVPVTENTITDPDRLFQEIEQIRKEGVAFNREESTLGLHAVSSVVKMPNGETLGALSVSGPAHRMEGNLFTKTLPNKLRGAAQELELNIKYSL